MKRLAILGASGHGKVLADTAELSGWSEVVFFDDAWPKLISNGNWEVIGNTDSLLSSLGAFDGVIVAIGNNEIRLNKTSELIGAGGELVSLIHPSAVVSRFSKISLGTFIGPGAVLQVDCSIGNACIINTNAVIEHDCNIFDGVHISPSAALAGGVSVGAKSWVGIGTSIKQLIKIGSCVVIGSGSVVIRDATNETVIAGNPAKPINIK